MEISLRRLIPTGLVLLLDTGLTVSGYVNTTLAFALWALMIPATLYGVWPWLKRVRVRSPLVLDSNSGESCPGATGGEVYAPTVTQEESSDAIQRLQAENKELRASRDVFMEYAETQLNRIRLRNALIHCLKDGLLITQVFLEDNEDSEGVERIENWEKWVTDIITDALGQEEAVHFLSDSDYPEPCGDCGHSEAQHRMMRRLQRLCELYERVDSLSKPLELRPDFDGAKWAGIHG